MPQLRSQSFQMQGMLLSNPLRRCKQVLCKPKLTCKSSPTGFFTLQYSTFTSVSMHLYCITYSMNNLKIAFDTKSSRYCSKTPLKANHCYVAQMREREKNKTFEVLCGLQVDQQISSKKQKYEREK